MENNKIEGRILIFHAFKKKTEKTFVIDVDQGKKNLRFQFVTFKESLKGRKYLASDELLVDRVKVIFQLITTS